jgi:hypothetical protein
VAIASVFLRGVVVLGKARRLSLEGKGWEEHGWEVQNDIVPLDGKAWMSIYVALVGRATLFQYAMIPGAPIFNSLFRQF